MQYHLPELIYKTHDYFPLKPILFDVHYLSTHKIVLEMENLRSSNFCKFKW